MVSAENVRLIGGQGMYGDSVEAIVELLEENPDYLVLEALAELTVAILAKDRRREPALGYTRDFGRYLDIALPAVAEGRCKLITNAGGINVASAGRLVAETADRLGLSRIRVATVSGDDLMPSLPDLGSAGDLVDMTDGTVWKQPPGDPLFANVYLGARPIVDALARGANVVITGRVADPALFLAPLVHEFGWSWDDHDRLAGGTVLGHLSECSAQSTGGNFSGEWWTIPDPWHFAYPVVDCAPDGSGVLRKAKGAGGRVDFDTVRHQLLYEVHDPAAYITPDVVVDFTTLRLDEVGADEVRISGVTGAPATGTYKALVAFENGWIGESRVGVTWPDAAAKARSIAQLMRKRVADAGLRATAWHEELWGIDAVHGPTVPVPEQDEAPEVMLRISWRAEDERTAALIGRQLPPIALSGPAWGVTGGRGMLNAPSAQLRLHPLLVEKGLVDRGVQVRVGDV